MSRHLNGGAVSFSNYMSSNKVYDVIIIGGAAAGLSAALYCARRALKTLVITKDIGGQANIADFIENYPGIKKIAGPELMKNFQEHAKKYGAEFIFDEVAGVEKQKGLFIVKARSNKYKAEALILAFGLSHRELNIPGEEKFKGRGVSFCATCDAPLYKDKVVAVVGGGNAALDAADLLAKNNKKIYLIHRRDSFRAEDVLIKQVQNNPKIEILYQTQVKEILGERFVKQIKVIDNQGKEERLINVGGLFEEAGYVAKADFLKGLVKLNKQGEIITDEQTKTSTEGIFAAGDCTDVPFKQVVISAGEGAKAGLGAYFYLQKKRGKDIGISVNWK